MRASPLRPTVVAVSIAITAACASARSRPPATTAVVALPGAYEPGDGAPATTLANQAWFAVFRDPDLQGLIRMALTENPNARLAASRVIEARASLGITHADQFPTISASAATGGQRTPALGSSDARTAGAVSLQGAVAWELDFWGRLRQATAAARADLVGAEWAQRAVMTRLVSDVATRFFTLRAFDAELAVARRTLTSRQASRDLAVVRERGGATSMVDVRQAEQLVYGASATIVDLERRSALEEHAIAVLIGRPGAAIARAGPDVETFAAPDVPAGLPSDLLARRPDILEAEQGIIAADATIEATRAQFFPRITLTGAGGLASTALTSLFSGGAGLWSAVASAVQPVFNANRIQSQVERAEARRTQAVIVYEATVREAFRQVADALVEHQKLREFREQQLLLQQAAADARRLAGLRYEGGATSYLEVLDADTRLFAAELGMTQARAQELTAFVELYRALGGGWQ